MRITKFVQMGLITGLILSGLLVLSGHAGAETTHGRGRTKPLVRDLRRVDANNLVLPVTNYGIHAFDVPNGRSGTEWPKGSGNFYIFGGGFYVGAKLPDGKKVVTVGYDQSNATSEFGAGPIIDGQSADPDQTNPLYRVYSLTPSSGPGDADYDQWPVADGAPVGPDGRPQVLSAQDTWSVYNDANIALHSGANVPGDELGIEVQQRTFSFTGMGAVNDIVFLSYTLINKGTRPLADAYIGFTVDVDLGDFADDLAGCDPARNIGFIYNANPQDTRISGRPGTIAYDILQGPVGAAGQPLGMTSFSALRGGTDPTTDEERYNLMAGLQRDGTPRPDGPFDFSDDPTDRNNPNIDRNPTDRRFLIASGPFQMGIGETQTIVIAIVAAVGTNNFDSVRAVRVADEQAKTIFNNGLSVPPTLAFSQAFARPAGQALVDVVLNVDEPVAGIQFTIQPNSSSPPFPFNAHFHGLINQLEEEGFTATAATDENGATTVLVVSLSGGQIPPGPHRILELIYDIDPATPPGTLIVLTVWDDLLSSPNSEAIVHILEPGLIHIGMPGDLIGGAFGDGDGHIDVLDVIKVINLVLRLAPMPPGGSFEFFVADMNGDGKINVIDIVRMIVRVVHYGGQPRVVDGPVSPGVVSLGEAQPLESGGLAIPVMMQTDDVIAGAQVELSFDPARLRVGAPQLAGRAAGMAVMSHVTDGTLRLIVYSLTGQGIEAGSGTTLLVPVTALGGPDATPGLVLSQAVLANRRAQEVPVTLGTSAVRVSAFPASFALRPNQPNPFNPATRLAYDVPQAAHVALVVYNLLGQEIVRLVDEPKTPGRYVVTWDGRNGQGQGVASGVYLYRLTSSTGFTQTRRMTLIK